MVVAWYMEWEGTGEDRRLELQRDPPEPVTLSELRRICGVLSWTIDPERIEDQQLYEKIRQERGYTYQDVIEISRSTLPDFDAKLVAFYTEHFHADEEIRYVTAGGGYFDVRDRDDRWIRVRTERGDLIVLPAGIHHRFTLDPNEYIKVTRLFVGEPVWTAINRPNEDHEARKKYLKDIESGML